MSAATIPEISNMGLGIKGEEKGRRDTDRTDRPRQTDKTERQTTDRRQATDKQTRDKQTENRQPGDQTDRGTEVRQVASFEPTSHASSDSTEKNEN